jgi:hypothetical protein
MKPHDTFLELAAVAIDFPLSSSERGRLEQHLAGCDACGRTAHALRGDNLALANLPPVTLPERRGAEILAAALHPPVVRYPLRLVAIAALLGLLLLGSLAVGSELLRRMDVDQPSVILPVPSSSPDASPAVAMRLDTLVVTRGEGDARWIEILAPDGTTTRLAEGRDPAWLSSDTIIYTCPDAGGQPGICSLEVDAQPEPRSLIAGADRPAPAPGSQTVAIHRGTIDVGETWLMSADGSNPRLVHSGAFTRWSPDGAWLAGQPEGAAAEIAVVGADGQGFKILAPGYDPAWSPTGRRIAFAVVEGDVASLRTVDVSSGAVEVLYTAPAGSEVSAPLYLEEGRIAFVQDGNVWVFDSSGPRARTSGQAIPGWPSGDPLAFSQDGRLIAFTNGTGTAATVGITTLRGEIDPYPWTGSGPVTQPAWAPASTPTQPSDGTPTASPGGSPVASGGEPLGTSWSAARMPVVVGRPIGRIEAVTAGGPGFVAVGRGCQDDACELPVWTSTDGTAWQRVPVSDALRTEMVTPTSGPELGMFDVAGGGPGVVAVGYAAHPKMEAMAWFSPDGVTWERFALGAAGSTRVNAVTWDGRQFVVVGEDRSEWDGSLKNMAKATARAAVWTSPDGRTWTRAPHTTALDVGDFIDTMEDPSTGGMNDVVAGPAGLVAVGSVCTADPRGCKPMAWTSTDGTSWERAAAMQAAGDQADISVPLNGVAASDAGYVAVGDNFVLASIDGRAWERTAQIGPLGDVTTIGKRYFATGSGDTGNETWAMPWDGVNWDTVTVGDPLPNTIYNPAEWHFAATQDVAVAVGPAVGTGDPTAMVSVAKTAP